MVWINQDLFSVYYSCILVCREVFVTIKLFVWVELNKNIRTVLFYELVFSQQFKVSIFDIDIILISLEQFYL